MDAIIPPPVSKTKFPFRATIRPWGDLPYEVIVWNDWIEDVQDDGEDDRIWSDRLD